MEQTRIEKDMLGERTLPAASLHGIAALRASENFPVSRRPVNRRLTRAYGMVKLACLRANHELGHWDEPCFHAMSQACEEIMRGEMDAHFITDALQGGAGTSTNMNVNEVMANRALILLGKKPGDHETLHPLGDANRHQSTNDTYPTALKVAAIFAIRELESRVVALLEAFQAKEKEFATVVKVARTQMQDAVLTTLGRQMSAYAEALARDRWRLYKCEERLRTINLGGTAIGTGLGAPRAYIFRATECLREITGIGLARAENMVEATQNTDVFVEVSGILRALASSLTKISGDIRFLSSGPSAGIGEIKLPPMQAGSSIMPTKVNPVIPEAVTQAAIAVLGHDHAITMACSMGHLELNPFLPLVADALLDSLDLLINACDIFRSRCIEGLEADADKCRAHIHASTATVTALVPLIGYEKAQHLALDAASQARHIRDLAIEQGIITAEQFDETIAPENVMRLGSPAIPDQHSISDTP